MKARLFLILVFSGAAISCDQSPPKLTAGMRGAMGFRVGEAAEPARRRIRRVCARKPEIRKFRDNRITSYAARDCFGGLIDRIEIQYAKSGRILELLVQPRETEKSLAQVVRQFTTRHGKPPFDPHNYKVWEFGDKVPRGNFKGRPEYIVRVENVEIRWTALKIWSQDLGD